MMDYIKESEIGEKICIDPIRVNEVFQMVKDFQKGDPVVTLVRAYYAGYSVGFRDGKGQAEAEHKGEGADPEPLDVK